MSRILAFPFWLAAKIFGFYQISVLISRLPFKLGDKIRYSYYKMELVQIGENVKFSYGTILTDKKIKIGNNVRFGPYNTVGLVNFGNDIVVGQYVHFLSGKKQHGTELNGVPMFLQPGTKELIKIGSDCWIGANSVIMCDIANGCVIGAGSVVIKKTTANSISAGNPCKLIKFRN